MSVQNIECVHLGKRISRIRYILNGLRLEMKRASRSMNDPDFDIDNAYFKGYGDALAFAIKLMIY